MKLVIAEKPVLARDIARAICGCAVSERETLPISGNGYTVVACAGHLLQLVEPDEINEAWSNRRDESLLPIAVKDWPKAPSENKQALVDTIIDLLGECESVIHAGDPDDEGQLIVDELLDYAHYQGKVERVYVNDNIESNIRRAFDNLVPNESCYATGRAAYARQIADMCFGVNESRLASIRLKANVSVGRVQTPTLGLVVKRDEEIANHIERVYFDLLINGSTEKKQALAFKLKPSKELLDGEKHIFDKALIETISRAIRDTYPDVIPFTTDFSSKQENAPLPYNLTELQADMSRRFGFGLEKTQAITQVLRDKYKAITYNRTDSQYLKNEHFAEAQEVVSQALINIDKADLPCDFTIKSRAFNDANVDAHHAIIPQNVALDINDLSKDEQAVYRAIVERYAMQFFPAAIYEISTSVFNVEGYGTAEYKTSRLLTPGWKAYFKTGNKTEENHTEENAWLEAGEHTLEHYDFKITEGTTVPPKPYTEGTLVKDMASIAKYVADPEIKAILKKKDNGKRGENGGIGTTATRAEIVEKLKKRGLIEEKSGKLRSTEKGQLFYHALPDDIKSADTTARWWLIQQDIAEGKADENAIQQSVVEIFISHRETAYVGKTLRAPAQVVGTCPICGKNVIAKKSSFQCESNHFVKNEDGSYTQDAGCGFRLVKWCGKKFTQKQAESLLSGKKITLRGCKSKKGNSFDCKLSLSPTAELEPEFLLSKKRNKR